MSEKWKVGDSSIAHFLTFAVVNWVDVFSRADYCELLLDSIKHCQREKGLELFAWVIMTNHVHMIARAKGEHGLPDIIRDLKKYTSVHICRAIEANERESRRTWMLKLFANEAARSHKHHKYMFWQQEYHPVLVYKPEIFHQKMDYIHENPVRAGIVNEPYHYRYSSAIDYSGGKGLLEIIHP